MINHNFQTSLNGLIKALQSRAWVIILLFSISSVPMSAQTNVVKLTPPAMPLEQVLSAIEQQTGYLFVYDSGQVDLKYSITLTKEQWRLSELLRHLEQSIGKRITQKDKYLSISEGIGSTPPVSSEMHTIRGKVVDQDGVEVIGATIQVRGHSGGTTTNLDGEFNIKASIGDVLVVSFVGFGSKTATIQNTEPITVILSEDTALLDEVVVIGYGSAKAKDLTSPITVVKGEEMLNIPASSPMSTMQGKVAGVNVINSGTPGDSPQVMIRGIGSFGSHAPLFVVDGMFYDNINFLNSNDIEEISILKDASAAAIYGVRAANGVVIISTKRGQREQDAVITYNGYIGMQNATNLLPMANSKEYATMLLEANYDAYAPLIKQSIEKFGGSYAHSDFHAWDIQSNTNWYEELLRPAMITDHSVGVSGGTNRMAYSLGLSNLRQDGIMNTENYFQRANLRASMDFDVSKWLTLGFNSILSSSNQVVPNNAAWQLAFNTPGIFPVMDPQSKDAFPEKFASPESVGFTHNFFNPIAAVTYFDSKNKTTQLLTGIYAQFSLLPQKLSFKTMYNYDFSLTRGRSFTEPHFVSNWQQQPVSTLTKTDTNFYNYVWDNTLNYTDQKGRHSWGAMIGYSMREQQMRFLLGSAQNVPTGADEWLYLGLGNQEGRTSNDGGFRLRGQSIFTRLNYDYAGRYIINATFRADGSSKYQEKWGFFPSVGLAWVLSAEDFMQGQKLFDFLKLRASWGRLGNDNVAASDGFASVVRGNHASGVFGESSYPGYQNTTYFSWLQWEIVDEMNVGMNLLMLSNRLSLDIDYFYRLTKRAVISPRLPFDNQVLAGNYGKILNSGVDLNLNWSDTVGDDFRYSFGANLSFLHNEVKDLGGPGYIQGGKTINMVGEQMNSFYGYKVIGIYQTDEEIANDPIASANGLQPGDFKYEDTNNNGLHDAEDRQILGSYIPSFIYGFNSSFEWKGLDLQVTLYGQAGAELFNRKRALRYAQSNYNFDKAQYDNRWTGPGSTNEHPSSGALIRGWNISDMKTNSYFIESADFFRIQNVTLGYTFRDLKFFRYTLPSARIALTADRPLTFFRANSFTPELTDPEGWDTNVYPLTSTYSIGLQIEF